MNNYIRICSFLILSLLAFGCGDMDDINTDKDKSTKVPAEYLAERLVLNMSHFNWSKGLFSENWIVKTMSFTEHIDDYLYNKFVEHKYDSFHDLIDAQQMLDIADENEILSPEVKNSYKGLYHFVRAFTFYETTMRLGDIPCSEAGKGPEGNRTPKYDTQEEVFGIIIRELEEASSSFAGGANFSGDAIYNGDHTKWHKLANSYMLRVLINLSKKTTVDGIDVKAKFAEYAQKTLFSSEEDNFQRVYSDKNNHRYPFNYLQQNHKTDAIMGQLLIDKLKELKDYRLFYYAEPAGSLAETHAENTFEAYVGVDVNLPFNMVQNQNANDNISRINLRYIYDPVNEPTAVISYSEVNFILAEAAVRGWISSSAKEFYDKGVSEAMKFTAKYTKEEYRHKMNLDDAYIASYLAAEGKYKSEGTTEQQIEQIIWQKFIASFVQHKMSPYYDYRRTSYPVIPINKETNLNRDPNKLPVRWMYDLDELKYNSENLKKAVESQFGGSDFTTELMWILK